MNRSLTFISKYFGGKIPKGVIEENIKNNIISLYEAAGKEIEKGHFKNALEDIFSLARYANKYFDEKQPWLQIKEDAEKCAITLYNCIQIIVNLSNLLTPFIPFSCDKIRGFLGIDKPKWSYIEITEGCSTAEPELLFQRIDKKVIDEEVQKLKVQNS